MLATLLVALVAIIHLAILVLEMFLWEGSAGRRAFNLSADFARQTRCWRPTRACITAFWPPAWHGAVAGGRRGCRWLSFSWPACWPPGIFGALTASRKILYIQALPALLALVAVLTQA